MAHLTRAQCQIDVQMLGQAAVSLAPGQSRAIPISLTSTCKSVAGLAFRLKYSLKSSPLAKYTSWHNCHFSVRKISEPHKVTFLHPSGTVSYAILRAPRRKIGTNATHSNLPLLLYLHGAGVEADSQQVRHVLDSVEDVEAWTLFPSGTTSWSSDDWREFAALHAVLVLTSLQMIGVSPMSQQR